MIIDSYDKTLAYEEENYSKAREFYAEELTLFKKLYDQNLEITNWLGSERKVDSQRSAFVLTLLHRALRFIFTSHLLVLRGQCDEARTLLRNVIELLIAAVDIRTHDRAWGEARSDQYSYKVGFKRIKENVTLARYHRWETEHGKLSGQWSHETFRAMRLDEVPVTHQDGTPAVRQELSAGYHHTNSVVFFSFADIIKLTREITQTIDFLFNGVLRRERADEWSQTKSDIETFLRKEEKVKKELGLSP